MGLTRANTICLWKRQLQFTSSRDQNVSTDSCMIQISSKCDLCEFLLKVPTRMFFLVYSCKIIDSQHMGGKSIIRTPNCKQSSEALRRKDVDYFNSVTFWMSYLSSQRGVSSHLSQPWNVKTPKLRRGNLLIIVTQLTLVSDLFSYIYL